MSSKCPSRTGFFLLTMSLKFVARYGAAAAAVRSLGDLRKEKLDIEGEIYAYI